MTLSVQVKILGDKIKANKAQYDKSQYDMIYIEKQLKYLHYQVVN